MGKSRRTDREYTKEQKLSKENKQLKRELAHLRKQISKMDIDRFESVKQICLDFEEGEKFQEFTQQANSNLEDLKKTWACDACKTGYLEISLYSKLGVTHYFRKCNSCTHRTKGKRYSAEVKGILKNG